MKSREDWLCDQLDRDDLSSELRTKYERELDAFAERFNQQQAKKKEAEQKEKERIAHIRAQLIAGNQDVIDVFGMQEFGDDYETVIEGTNHIIYSKVARDDQENRHVFNDKDSAYTKLRKLVWDRMYSKYVRTGELDSVFDMGA